MELKSKLRSDDPEGIGEAQLNLRTRLDAIEEFPKFIAAVEENKHVAAQTELNSFVARAGLVIEFVQDYVRSNITSDAVESLLKLNGEVASATNNPKTESLKTVIQNANN